MSLDRSSSSMPSDRWNRQAPQHSIDITFPAFDSPCFVRSNQTPMKQVLIVLYSNKIRISPTTQEQVVHGLHHEQVPGPPPRQHQGHRRGIASGKTRALFQPFNRLGQEAGGVEGRVSASWSPSGWSN